MADGTVTIDVIMDDGSVKKGIANIGGSFDDAGKQASGLGAKLKSAFSIGGAMAIASKGIELVGSAIKASVGEAVSSSDAMDKFASTMGFAGYDSKKIKAAQKDVKQYADETVYDLGDISNMSAQLAANGIGDFMGLTKAAGNLNAVAGGNADTFKSVGTAMTQTAGAGKLTTENWNQLADAIPGASGRMQEAMKKAGAYTGDFREAMAKGEITSDEFNAAIMKLGSEPVAVEAATSVKTFEGAMGGMQASIVSGIMGTLDIFKGPLAGGIASFSEVITKAFDVFNKALGSAFEWVTKLWKKIGETGAISRIADAFKTLFYAFGEVAKTIKKGLGLDKLGKTKTIDSIAGAFEKVADFIVLAVYKISDFIFWISNSKFASFALGLLGVGTAGGVVSGVFKTLSGVFSTVGGVVKKLTTGPLKLAGGLFTKIGTAASSAGGAVSKGFGSIITKLAPVFSKLGPIIGNVVTKIGPLASSFAGFLGPIGMISVAIGGLVIAFMTFPDQACAAVTKFAKAFFIAFDLLVAQIPALVGSLAGLFMTIGVSILKAMPSIVAGLGAILAAFVGVFVGLAGAILANMPAIISGFTMIITAIGMLMVALAPQMAFWAVSALAAMIAGITSALPQLIKSVANLIVVFIAQLTLALPKIMASGVGLLIAFIKGLTNAIPKVIPAIITMITTYINTVAANMGKIVSSGVNLMVKFINAVASNADKIVGTVVNLIVKFAAAVGNHLGPIADAAVKLVVKFINTIADRFPTYVDKIMDSIANLMRSVGTAIGRSPGYMMDIGRNLVEGIIAGLSQSAGKLGESVKAMAKGAVDSVKKALGIHSPSRVFRDQIGKFIPSGIAVGIEANTKTAQKAMVNLSDMLANTKPHIAIQAGISDAQAIIGNAFSGNAQGAVDNSKRADVNITNYVQANPSEAEQARQFSKQLRQMAYSMG
jgi:tape measure domain-containing protein